MLSNVNTKAANTEHLFHHVYQGFNLFQDTPCIASDLPKPKLLHTMQIGLLEQHQKWIYLFMKTPEQLNKYNAMWFSVPAYQDLRPTYKS
jgi:hypothetical protein